MPTSELQEGADRLGRRQGRSRLLDVVVVSALSLFVELLVIRWLDSMVRPLAFVKNLPLMASFLGLGIGYATAGRKRLVPLASLLLSFALGLGLLTSGFVTGGPTGAESNLGFVAARTGFLDYVLFYAIIAGVFATVVMATIPIGQMIGETMSGLPSLRAYSANVLGSLLGVGAAFVLASVSSPLWVSALLALALLIAYQRMSVRMALVSAVAGLAIVASMAIEDARPGHGTVWSPYNKIQVAAMEPERTADGQAISPGYVLAVQNLYYQRMLDLSAGTMAQFGTAPSLAQGRREYDFPYTWKKPRRVLIVGAGTGNDVAAALRAGAEHVDAVEIDPRIQHLGRELHPEHPYQDPRVRAVTNDARAVLRSAGEPYDMIVFGLLDAHFGFYSSLSGSIRLDNYVYTVECMKDALSRLTPDGVVSMCVYVERPWIAARLQRMVEEASGRVPLVAMPTPQSFTYLFGPGVPESTDRKDTARGLASVFDESPPGPIPHDDWPYLYLLGRTVPGTVLMSALGILLVTSLLVRVFFREGARFDRHFFFLGAGFLLVETRTIAQVALLYGTTWRVSAIAIAVILALALIANAIVERRGPLQVPGLYALLLSSLALGYVIPIGAVLGRGPAAPIAMTILLALPVVFAALVFSSSIAGLPGLQTALASNLVGGVLGGLLENLSLMTGISALGLVAAGLYALSYPKRR